LYYLQVVMDKNTGKCKGYGFVLYRRRSGAKNALREPQKKIGNRMAACQLASLGPVPANATAPAGPAPPVSEYTQRKIFISNVSPDVDPQKLLQFFAKFGEIEEGPLGLDKATGKPKGFALFVYKSVESAKRALQEPHKKFEGEVLHCQRAIDGPRQGKIGFTKNAGPGFQGRNNPNQVYGGGVPGAQVVAPAGLPGLGLGHLIAPAGPAVQVPGPAVAAPGLNPALGQALTAFLATQLGALGQGGAAGVGAGPPQGYGYGAPGGPYGGPPQGGPGRGGGGYMGGI
jgi:heterogeneous nuclear ribonucleoprotein A1/A3